MNEVIVMHLLEGSFAIDYTGRSMSLIANRQIKVRQTFFLGVMNDLNALICRKDDIESIIFLRKTFSDGMGIGCRREWDIGYLAIRLILELTSLAIRANNINIDSLTNLIHPIAH